MNLDSLINEVIPQPKKVFDVEQFHQSTLILSDMLDTMVYEESIEMGQVIAQMQDIDKSLAVLESIDVEAPDFEVRLEATMNAYGIAMAKADNKEKKQGFLSDTIAKLKEAFLILWDKLQKTAIKYYARFTKVAGSLRGKIEAAQAQLRELEKSSKLTIVRGSYEVSGFGIGDEKGPYEHETIAATIEEVNHVVNPLTALVNFEEAFAGKDIEAAFGILADRYRRFDEVATTGDTITFNYGYVVEIKLAKNRITVSSSIDKMIPTSLYMFSTNRFHLPIMLELTNDLLEIAISLEKNATRLSKEWTFTKRLTDKLNKVTDEKEIEVIKAVSTAYVPFVNQTNELLAKLTVNNFKRVTGWLSSIKAE